MSNTQVTWARTGYLIEYLARGARKPRREFVTEVVPIVVTKVEEIAPAVIDVDGTPLLYVHDGILYDRIISVDAFEANARSTDPLHFDTVRQNYYRPGLKDQNLNTAPSRDSLQIKELPIDEREDGLAWAQQNADRLLISDGYIYRQPSWVPMQVVSLGYELNYSVTSRTRSRSFENEHLDGLVRFFRHGDDANILSYLERRTGKENPTTDWPNDRPAITWTDEGLAAEDMQAWWLLWRACDIMRSPSQGTNDRPMQSSLELLQRILDIRRMVEPYRDRLPQAQFAGDLAREVIVKLEDLQEYLESQSGPMPTALKRSVKQLVTEAKAIPPKLATQPEDDEILADMAAPSL